MKKWWVVAIIILALFALAIYLNQAGIIKWQFLTMIAAALAGPFKYLTNLFGGKSKEQEIVDFHKAVRERETKYQEDLQDRRDVRTEKVELLNQDLKIIDEKLKELQVKKAEIDKEVDDMTIDELKQAGKDEFGD